MLLIALMLGRLAALLSCRRLEPREKFVGVFSPNFLPDLWWPQLMARRLWHASTWSVQNASSQKCQLAGVDSECFPLKRENLGEEQKKNARSPPRRWFTSGDKNSLRRQHQKYISFCSDSYRFACLPSPRLGECSTFYEVLVLISRAIILSDPVV